MTMDKFKRKRITVILNGSYSYDDIQKRLF